MIISLFSNYTIGLFSLKLVQMTNSNSYLNSEIDEGIYLKNSTSKDNSILYEDLELSDSEHDIEKVLAELSDLSDTEISSKATDVYIKSLKSTFNNMCNKSLNYNENLKNLVYNIIVNDVINKDLLSCTFSEKSLYYCYKLYFNILCRYISYYYFEFIKYMDQNNKFKLHEVKDFDVLIAIKPKLYDDLNQGENTQNIYEIAKLVHNEVVIFLNKQKNKLENFDLLKEKINLKYWLYSIRNCMYRIIKYEDNIIENIIDEMQVIYKYMYNSENIICDISRFINALKTMLWLYFVKINNGNFELDESLRKYISSICWKFDEQFDDIYKYICYMENLSKRLDRFILNDKQIMSKV